MRTLVLVLAALLALTGCAASVPSVPAPKVDVNTPQLRALKAKAGIADCVATTAGPAKGGLPDVTVPCLGGGPSVNLAGLRGPMVVNLWAQYCGPCRTEMPHLQAFAQRYGTKVPVLGVDYLDVQPQLALEFARQAGATYPMVSDIAKNIRVVGLPTTILIDKDGRIAYQQGVELKSVAQLKQLVAEHLGIAL
jgi:thiol-disulfide isomerase/thioredoxin